MFYKLVTDIKSTTLREYLLRGSAYFLPSLPEYITFDPVLREVATFLDGQKYGEFGSARYRPRINYTLYSNKRGMLDWRPLDFVHPVIYVSLANLICQPENWACIVDRFRQLNACYVECYSIPTINSFDVYKIEQPPERTTHLSRPSSVGLLRGQRVEDGSWTRFQKRSISLSLNYDYMLQSDIENCYGSMNTHSIPWALYDIEVAKVKRNEKDLLGNLIDRHLRACRYGQSNGICQGNMLMDILAELVLAFVDYQVVQRVLDDFKRSHSSSAQDFKILRYRDDYRIFADSEECARRVLKALSDKLLEMGMKLSAQKTTNPGNVIENVYQPDSWTIIENPYPLDVSTNLADTMRIFGHDLILRLHLFGRQHPNSKELGIMMATYANSVLAHNKRHFLNNMAADDVRLSVAVILDVALHSPSVFPTAVFILSHLIAMSDHDEREELWSLVRKKVGGLPNNGYQDIWLQRIAVAQGSGLEHFVSDERICKIVAQGGGHPWINTWIDNVALRGIMDSANIVDLDTLNNVSTTMEKHELRKQLERYISG